MRGLALVGVVMAACTMDNPQFVPAYVVDGTAGTTEAVTTGGSTPTSDPTATGTGAMSGTSTPTTSDTGATGTGTGTGTGTDTDTGSDTGVMPICGDGITQPELGEACDDGVNNGVQGFCDATCTAKLTCGDAIVTPPESCDDGNNLDGDGCDPMCALESCGDAMIDPGEECDDGNQLNNDNCTNSCLFSICGDSIVQDGAEACDDGNLDNSDDCLNSCQLALCGDGFLHADVEECDDGNGVDNDACSNLCKAAECGDGIHQQGEECDDGNDINGDACLNSCKLAVCGDGVLYEKAEQCDLGPGLNKDEGKCTSKCQNAKCGDGLVQIGVEQCDDGNQIGADACTNVCTLNYCLRVENSNQENLFLGNLDLCVMQQNLGKKNVAIALLQGKNLVYSGGGQLPQNWSLTNLTSSMAEDLQFNVANHDNIITLKNGDKLMLTGHKSDAGAGCWQSMGNGYGIAVYPPVPDTTKNVKLMVMSYKGGVSGQPRTFPNWTPSSEIAWNGGQSMSVCDPMGPTAATEHVFFLHVF
jgi:cysteine-rich repeat protein